MILSASDIRALLTRDPVLGALATVRIIDRKPPLEAGNGVYVYIKKYPAIQDFEATWSIWIVDYDEEPLDVILSQIRRLLPAFTILESGAIIKATTTELKTDKTEVEPPQSKAKKPEFTAADLEARFEELKQSIQDRMLLVGPGRPGKDGKNGADGKDGRNGKDINATDTKLGELKDVFIDDAKRGQFLMYDGADWVSRSVPQVLQSGKGGIDEPPKDGRFYVRVATETSGEWVDLLTALQSLSIDAGNFDG